MVVTMPPEIRKELLAAIPSLRAFGISLCGNPDRADDLVQEAITRAITRIDLFEPGTKLQAWLFTILRNHFYSEHRKRVREVQDSEGTYAATLITLPDQEEKVAHQDLLVAVQKLPVGQRDVLLLVGAQGLSYRDAAASMGLPEGTIKSRANRARANLAKMFNGVPGDPGAYLKAV
jgi:RNA polymerase sigma-70 factor, ECF subfamily